MTNKEYIAHAAIQQDGKLYVGHRHFRIIQDIADLTGERLKPGAIQGFTTTKKHFVGRQEALAIALAAGQIKEATPSGLLFSEDIWPSKRSTLAPANNGIYLSVGDLRSALVDLPDTAKVYYQRIEDVYFDKYHWSDRTKATDNPDYPDDPDIFDEWVRAYSATKADDGDLHITAHY